MFLSPDEAKRYHDIYPALLRFAVERVAPASIKQDLLRMLRVEIRAAAANARDLLFDNPELIIEFVQENPASLDPRDLEIARSWTTFRKGKFVILRTLRHYAVFIAADEPASVYGVLGLFSKTEQMLGSRPLPALVETVLLPWEGRVIHDGFFRPFDVALGPNIRQKLQAEFLKAKASNAIVTSFVSGLRSVFEANSVPPDVRTSSPAEI